MNKCVFQESELIDDNCWGHPSYKNSCLKSGEKIDVPALFCEGFCKGRVESEETE